MQAGNFIISTVAIIAMRYNSMLNESLYIQPWAIKLANIVVKTLFPIPVLFYIFPRVSANWESFEET